MASAEGAPQDTAPETDDPTATTDAAAGSADAAATTTPAPPPEAEAGLLINDLREDIPRQEVSQPTEGVFGTPDGTVEITSVGRADSVPGHVHGGPESAYVAAPGEEFYVFEVSFVPGEDDQTPPTELHVDSQGTRKLVKELSQGDSSFLASLPVGGEGASLVVSADGHEQVFDIATGARVADPLTDTYLRRVVQQDLTDVLSYGPVPGYEDRQFTADVRLRSARITPYVPPRIGSQRWAEPGSMWLVMEYRLEYDATRAGWSDRHATLTWTIEGAEPVVQEGRLWGRDEEVVMSIPADFDSFDVAVANQAELRERFGGSTVKEFGSESFSLSFPVD
ncbi:hypothetical protein [Ornithinicoccus hortensis]|uniref:Uncharacterized protein n=1 Tax=Ornithinicoccus hortensis TaxID=82346 RepID=A0A542YWF0_9MICO|nr:hypothetical protein [Ornithinicoccus hortensis]TQL52416.1 hypothetical protein FB467_3602 [Ornithinicoccus hortensis]